MGSELAKQPESQGLNLTDIMTAINLGGKTFAGTGGSSTQTGTKGQKFSQEQMNTMLQSILEQTGGYADIGQQVHGAGGYNSTTQGLMLNDLLTRSAQRVAELNTEQTESVTKTEQTDPLIGTEGLAGMAGALGLGQLLSSGASALGMGSAIKSGVGAASKALGFGETAASAGGAAGNTAAFDSFAVTDSAGNILDIGSSSGGAVDAASTVAADSSGFWSGASDFATGSGSGWQGTAGNVAGGAMAAYNAYNDIKDDNWGGAVGTSVGAWFGGPAGAAAGQLIGTAADKYILDPLNNKVVKPIGHAFDEAITQNVGSAVKSIGKAVSKPFKKLFCFLGGTRILMADGTYKEISTLALNDNVAIGGRVTAIGSALAEDIYSYKGELCSGSHVVLEDEVWIPVKDSELATGPHGVQEYVVHPITTENHVLVTANGFISSDYAGVDGDYTEVQKLEILNADTDRTADLAAELDDLFAETVQE